MGLFIKTRLSSERGFALVTAIMACAILFALAMLILNLSTGDLKVSSKSVGDKKASIAAESGIQILVQNFSPDSTSWTEANFYTTTANCTATTPTYIWRTAALDADDKTQYAVCRPTASSLPPVRIPGYALGGGDEGGWGIQRYDARVGGKNDSYNSSVSVDVGIGYGPVPIK